VIFGVLCYASILLTDGADSHDRIILLRFWGMFAGGIFAVAVPHLLLPDSNLHILQLMNARPEVLLWHQLTIWMPVVAVFAVPTLLLAFYAPEEPGQGLAVKAPHALAQLFLILGIGLYSFERYATIGQTSQEWQEGTRGQAWKAASEHGPVGLSFGMPPGLIPAVTASGRIFGVAVLFVIAGALMRPLTGDAFVWLPGLVLLAWSGYRIGRRKSLFDRHFYCTNAFYREIFRSAGRGSVSDSRPLPYESLYWVPARWQPHVWASLRQLDRRLPLGRFIAAGHVLLWFLVYQDATPTVLTAYLLIFSAGKNGVVGLLATRPFAPPSFQLRQQSAPDWMISRFFVNLRWTFPWGVSLLLVAFFDTSFTYRAALGWTGLDILLALVTAAAVTWRVEGRFRSNQ
jgi:hypothetical protein